MYASDLLFILVLVISKVSVVCTLSRIVSERSLTKKVAPVMHIAIALWAVFSIVGVAFQCSFPKPWLYVPTQCVASGALWYPVLLTGIMVDVLLSVAIWPEKRTLSLRSGQATRACLLFGARSIVCFLSIAHLALLAPALRSETQSISMVVPTMMRQIVMNMSVVTAAVLALYRPLAMLGSTPIDVLPCKELSPPSSAHSSKKFNLGAWMHKRTDVATSQKTSDEAPQLTLSFNAYAAERASRSLFGNASASKKGIRSSLSCEELIIQRTLEWDVERSGSKQHLQELAIIEEPVPAHHKR